nr:dihydroneopterin aldolase 2 isoform X5 [Ziziphus jujuba var. spinosa]
MRGKPHFPLGVGMEDAAIPKGDKLILRGLKFHGFHGVKPEERKLGQKFLVDVDAWMDLHPAGLSDRLSDTISYTEIYRIVKEVIEGQPHNLLESVAQLIASTTLTRYPQISAVRVSVGKPHVSVQGPLDCLGVEIHRYRSIHIPNSLSLCGIRTIVIHCNHILLLSHWVGAS